MYEVHEVTVISWSALTETHSQKWLADDGGLGMAKLVAASFTTYVGGLVASGFLYHVYASDVEESLNIALITLTLCAAIGYTLLSLLKRVCVSPTLALRSASSPPSP
jgi:hypothetical protein